MVEKLAWRNAAQTTNFNNNASPISDIGLIII